MLILRLLRALACILASCLVLAPTAQALDGSFRLTDFRHDAWGPKDGAPQMPIALAQTTDGWLWIGAYHGLYRFDGVRFERFEPLPGEALLYNTISTLGSAPNGDLLIGYMTGGLSVLRKGHLLHMTSVQHQPFSTAFTVLADIDGSYWVGAIDGLMHLRGGTWEKIGRDRDYPGIRTDNLTLDRFGRLFVSDGDAFYMLDRTRRKFVRTGLRSVENNADFLFDQNQDLWVGTDDRLRRVDVDPGALPASYKPGDALTMMVERVFDRDGNLWFRNEQARVCMLPRARLPQGAAFSLKALLTQGDCTNDGPAAPKPMGLLEDRSGNIWVVRTNGLERFRRNRLRTIVYANPYSRASVVRDPYGAISVTSGDPPRRYVIDNMTMQSATAHADTVLQRAGRDATLLLATPGGLVVQEPGGERTIPYPQPRPAATDRIRHLIQEDQDAFWVGWSRHGLWRYAGGQWRKATDYGVPVARAGDASDGRGTVWLGYANNTIVRLGRAGVRKFDASDGVDVRVATFIDVQREVLAAGDGGLQVLDSGRFRHVRTADPDALTGINGLAIAPDGDRWFNTHLGLLHVRARDWQEAMRAPDTLLRYELLDQFDGFPDGAQVNTVGTATAAPDGRMWFAATGGIAFYDPRHDVAPLAPPPPTIRAVIANGRRFDPQLPIRLPPGTDHVAIEFSALNYTTPERTVFRYRLEGAERNWQGPLAVRYISYANLAPGSYTFALQAANQGGAWSGQTARVGFEVLPRFTQTAWFMGLCALALAGAAALFYRWRMREVTARLHLLLRERQRIARALHDTFLQSLQSLVWRFDQVKDGLPLQHQDRRLLDATLAQANQVMAEGRHQILDLRPGADGGLALEARLAMARESFGTRYPAAIDVALDNPRRLALLPIVADEAFHIANEALRNALYHGRAARVEVALDYTPAAFVLRVRDDGGGFDPALLDGAGRAGHWGLAGMRERARAIGGTLAIDTGKDGTTVLLRVPKALAYGRPRRPQTRPAREEERC